MHSFISLWANEFYHILVSKKLAQINVRKLIFIAIYCILCNHFLTFNTVGILIAKMMQQKRLWKNIVAANWKRSKTKTKQWRRSTLQHYVVRLFRLFQEVKVESYKVDHAWKKSASTSYTKNNTFFKNLVTQTAEQHLTKLTDFECKAGWVHTLPNSCQIQQDHHRLPKTPVETEYYTITLTNKQSDNPAHIKVIKATK